MRYLAYEDGGVPTMGVLAPGGRSVVPVAPLEAFYADIGAFTGAAGAAVGAAARPLDGIRMVPPVPATARVLCLGLNYRAHAAESGAEAQAMPTVFARFASTLSCDGDAVSVLPREDRLDWEAELVAVLGADLVAADARDAQRAVFAYACGNDLSARTFQAATTQWALGKNGTGTAPIGPVLVSADELGDPHALSIECRVNGSVMQSASTAGMIFSVGEALSYISGAMELRPGDVLFTGTPEGVGFTREPPVFLHPGDVVEVEIDRIGVLTNSIVSPIASQRRAPA